MGEVTKHRLAQLARWLPVAMLCVLIACGSGNPSSALAEHSLRGRLDDGNEQRLQLRTFTKTDGRASEMMGAKAYTIMFTADAEFVGNALFTTGEMLGNEGTGITTSAFKAPSKGFSWNDWFSATGGNHPAFKGDHLHLRGEIQFEKRESGWVPNGVRLRYLLDSSARAPDALAPSSTSLQREVIPQEGFLVGIWNGDDGQNLDIKPISGTPPSQMVDLSWSEDSELGVTWRVPVSAKGPFMVDGIRLVKSTSPDTLTLMAVRDIVDPKLNVMMKAGGKKTFIHFSMERFRRELLEQEAKR